MSRSDRQHSDTRYYNRVVRVLSGFTRSISKTTIVNQENLPLIGSVIVAPNHISNLDPIVLGVTLVNRRRIHALAKESLFRVPLVGKVLTKMGHIPVHRGTVSAGVSLVKAEELLNEGDAIAVYPEGTIPKENLGTIGPFKTGAARLAFKTGAPILPVGQWGAHDILPRSKNAVMSLLKAVFKRPSHTVVVGELIYPSKFSTIDELNNELRTRLQALTIEASKLTPLSSSPSLI